MYKQDIKEMFIESYVKSRVIGLTSLHGLFNKIAPFEYALNKDCSKFTQKEVMTMYEKFKAKSVNVILNYNSILKAYCKWKQYYYINENICTSYEDITIDMIKSVVPKNTSKTLTREEITEIEDQLYNWTDKAIVECLFEGLAGNSMSDLVKLNIDMIDNKNKNIIFDNGRVYHMIDRLHHLLINAFNETEYICYGKTLRVKQLIGHKQLYKERDNAHAQESDDKYFRWVYRKIQNIRNFVGIPGLTMKNIATSGMCHYLKLGMETSNCDLKVFLNSKEGNELMDKYGYCSEFRINNVMLCYKDLIQ